MWVESREWMKFGGKAFFCFTVSGLLGRDRETSIYLYGYIYIYTGLSQKIRIL